MFKREGQIQWILRFAEHWTSLARFSLLIQNFLQIFSTVNSVRTKRSRELHGLDRRIRILNSFLRNFNESPRKSQVFWLDKLTRPFISPANSGRFPLRFAAFTRVLARSYTVQVLFISFIIFVSTPSTLSADGSRNRHAVAWLKLNFLRPQARVGKLI